MSEQGLQDAPRSAAGLIVDACVLYRRYPLLFLVLAAAVIVPYQVILLVTTETGLLTQSTLSSGASFLLTLADWALITPLVSSLHIHAVAESRMGDSPRLGLIAQRGVRALPTVAVASVVSWLGITLGLFALIVPGILLMLRWIVVAQAAALDRDGWRAALRRSADLTEGRYGHVFVFVVLLSVVTVPPTYVLGLPFGETTTVVSFFVGLALLILTASFGALAGALLYFDLRSRRATAPSPPATAAAAKAGPSARVDRPWDPRAFSDSDRPRGWFIDPDRPEQMRYWGGDGIGWSRKLRTSRKIRRDWERQRESETDG